MKIIKLIAKDHCKDNIDIDNTIVLNIIQLYLLKYDCWQFLYLIEYFDQ